jgi:hypothetical protein
MIRPTFIADPGSCQKGKGVQIFKLPSELPYELNKLKYRIKLLKKQPACCKLVNTEAPVISNFGKIYINFSISNLTVLHDTPL